MVSNRRGNRSPALIAALVNRPLRLQCHRLVVSSGSHGLEYKDSGSSHRKRDIDVQYGTVPISRDGIDSTLSKVFVSGKDDFVDSMAPSWKKCITAALNAAERDKPGACLFSPQLRSLLSSKSDSSSALRPAPVPIPHKAEPEGIFDAKALTTPPKAISTQTPRIRMKPGRYTKPAALY